MAASASQAQQNEPDSPAALGERYVAAFNAHDAEAFGEIVAANYIQHNRRTGPGLAGLQAALRQACRAKLPARCLLRSREREEQP
jgi:hypothetical protein